MIYASRLAGRTDVLAKTREQCLLAVFDPIGSTIAPAIIAGYGLEASATSNNPQNLQAVLTFGNGVMFFLPACAFARAWSRSLVAGTEAFLYHFNRPNPWEGPWKGHSSHSLDMVFLFQNYNNYLSLGQRQCAERHAREVIAFVNGKDPWPSYQCEKMPGALVYYAAKD